MTPGALNQARRRDRRITALERRSSLTPAERRELQHLTEARDHMWRRLMSRIDRHTAALRRLETYADEIGLRGANRRSK
ncbi:hypothetical protein RN629_01170 [Sphingomonadaceae bacterium jetA1]|jgi:hypothetical protein|uniref:hypothetical protein n=1 Tax=Facivitalis istanbulensis TaxID=3075838 RepID=UPI0034873DB4